MQRADAAIGLMVTFFVILAVSCGSSLRPIDTSDLRPVACPTEAVPTELEVACYQYLQDDGHLTLAVLNAAAASDHPVLVIHGGPGGRVVAERHHWLVPPSPILAHHDMLLVDQRGSGSSQPSLDCPEVDNLVGSLNDAYRTCRARLVANGVDLDNYQVKDIVADLTALRRSIGIDRWNLYAISFGTLVAIELLRTDSNAIVATVLDSPMPPHFAAYDELPQGASSAIDKALAGCTEVEQCPTNQAGELDTLLQQLNKTPATVTVRPGSTRTIDDVAFSSLLLNALAHPDGPSALRQAVGMATEGRMAEAVAVLEGLSINGRTIGDSISEGAQLSSECADVLPHNKVNDPLETRPLLQAIAGLEVAVRELCSIWDVPAATAESGLDLPTGSDVLVLSGHLDPVTPTAWARKVVADLDGAILLESESWGHAPSFTDPCAANLVSRFFDGSRPEPGIVSC